MEQTELVEANTAAFETHTLESIAHLVGKIGGRYVMPCGIVAAGVLLEMNKLLNPVEVRVEHRIGMRHRLGPGPLAQDVLVFETMNEKQRTLLHGVVFP